MKQISSPAEDPWNSWSMLENTPGTEVAVAAAEWYGQENPSLCSSESPVAAEPHHTDLMLLGQRGGSQCKHCSDEHSSKAHNSHRWSGSISGHSNLRYKERHTTKRTSTLLTSYG